MLEQLIQQITQRVGISSTQAQGAISVVIDFVRQHIPALAPYLSMLGGDSTGVTTGTPAGTAAAPPATSGDEGGLNNILGNITGMFDGQQREKLHSELTSKANLAPHQANGVIDAVQQFLGEHLGSLGNLGNMMGTQGSSDEGGLLGQAEGMLGGLFGGDKK